MILSAKCSSSASENYDLIVMDATPCGVACAVRAARGGLTVLLINHTPHLGGMLANGLGVWDTLYAEPRAPLYDELRSAILGVYRRYGESSPQYITAQADRGSFEPKVVEAVIDQMIAAEPNVTVWRNWLPTDVCCEGRLIRSITLRERNTEETRTVFGSTFADASYEADLAALAGVDYRVGRESREEFGEPHAGEIFTRIVSSQEGRRIVGRSIFTENDALLAPGLRRAPINSASIAITEWPLDSHECRRERRAESVGEGKVLLTEDTLPGQISYDCLLPKTIDNLLVPMCLSASHIGWGTVRLEPTVMNIGESAGYAAVLSHRGKIPVAAVDRDRLLVALAEARVMITFFNDINLASADPWIPAVEFFGTKGFFPTYDAQADQALDEVTARHWSKIFSALLDGRSYSPDFAADEIPADGKSNPVSVTGFQDLISCTLPDSLTGRKFLSEYGLSRGEACELLLVALKRQRGY